MGLLSGNKSVQSLFTLRRNSEKVIGKDIQKDHHYGERLKVIYSYNIVKTPFRDYFTRFKEEMIQLLEIE